jgi:DNA primase
LFSTEVLLAAGLTAESRQGSPYDRFRGRVLFPIRDLQRRPVAFGGRVLPGLAGDVAKYINTQETPLFTKSAMLYGLDEARDAIARQRHAVLVEGYTDVVIAHQHGIRHVVAVLGTAVGPEHIRLLKRFAHRVTLVLDGDQAGQKRANEVLELFVRDSLDLRVVTLPAGLDPCEYLLKHGKESFEDLIQRGVDALEHHIATRTAGLDLVRETQAASQALESILALLSKVTRLGDTADSSQRLREQLLISRLTHTFAVPEATVRDRLAELRRSRPGTSLKASAREPQLDSPWRLTAWESELFRSLLRCPHMVSRVIENVAADDLPTEPGRQLLATACQLEANGLDLDFTRMMTDIEDERLKNILVELDETGQQLTSENDQQHLEDVLAAFRQARQRRQRDDEAARIKSGALSDQQSLDRLAELVASRRKEELVASPRDDT